VADIKTKIVIEVDFAGAVTSLRAVEQAGKSAFDKVAGSARDGASGVGVFGGACDRAASSAIGLIKGLVGFAALQGAASSMREVADSTVATAAGFEKTEKMLTRLTGSAEGGRQSMDWLLRFSSANPVMELQAYRNAFVKLQVAGLDPMGGSLKTLTDTIAAFGGGGQEMERASVAIIQMAGKGVISMEELRQQLGEVIPTAMRTMADEMGLSMQELSKRIESGALDAGSGLDALFRGLQKNYDGAAAEMAGTWDGMVSGAKTAMQKMQVEIMNAGAFDALKKHFQALPKNLGFNLDASGSAEMAADVSGVVRTVLDALTPVEKATGAVIRNLDTITQMLIAGAWAKYALDIGAAERAMVAWFGVQAAAEGALVSQITLWNKLSGLQAIRAPLDAWITSLGTINTLALSTGAAFAGWEIGQMIEKSADPWGIHATEKALKDAETGLAEAKGERARRLAGHGFTGDAAMEKFNAAVASGKMVYDADAHAWVLAQKKKKQAAVDMAKAVETATKGVEAYARAMSALDAESEKAWGQWFGDAMKHITAQVAGDGENLPTQIDITSMRAPLDEYIKALDAVYSRRRAIEQGAMDALVQSGAPRDALAGQQKLMLEIDTSGAQARLAAWQQYYSALDQMHKQAVDAQIAKTKELADLEKTIRQQREDYGDLELGLRQRLMSPLEQYYSTQDALEQQFRAATALSGQERIDALVKFQQAAAGAAREISDGDWMLTLEQTVTHALGQVRDAQSAIVAEQERMRQAKQDEITAWGDWQTAVETAMSKADEMMEHYRDRIIDLDNLLHSLDTEITITLNDQVSGALGTLRAKIQGFAPDVSTTSAMSASFDTGQSPEPAYTPSDKAMSRSAHNVYTQYSFEEASRRKAGTDIAGAATGATHMITIGDIYIGTRGFEPATTPSGEAGASLDIDAISREVARQLKDRLQRRFN